MMNCLGNINSVKPVSQAVKKEIFGILVDDIDCVSLSEEINMVLYRGKKIIINYLNAYSVTILRKNKIFKKAIRNADVVHADGIGIWLASRILKNSKLRKRFNFTDGSSEFLADCQKNGWSLFFLGANDGTLQKAVIKLKLVYPGIKVAGTLNGYKAADSERAIEIINEKSPDILWVGMGTPKQEIWIYNNKQKLNCKVIQSVGDLITYLAGEKTRGPLLVQKFGFEWLARLLRHPGKYFDRYVVGIPLFILIILKEILFTHKNS